MLAADREVAWDEHFLASREMMEMKKRLCRLIDALEEKSDEVMSEDDPTRIDFVREYRQSLKDGFAVLARHHVAIEDAELFGAVEAGIAALESEEHAGKFMKGMTAYIEDAEDDPD